MAWLICNFHLPQWFVAIIATFYEPLIWVDKIFPGGVDWMKGYVGLWTQGKALKSGPAYPLPFLGELLAVSIACWFIWNVVGWFTSGRRHPHPEVTKDTDILPDHP